jgi:hypothetical protein
LCWDGMTAPLFYQRSGIGTNRPHSVRTLPAGPLSVTRVRNFLDEAPFAASNHIKWVAESPAGTSQCLRN